VLEFWAHEIERVGGANRAAKTIARSLRRPREGVRR
jgi:hypothetical protein